ncbi:MAG: redoxin domain-containing protein [Candidatus Marinimicrobia bacterium]|nr:redoxin domain-containing protein [Candidatus Neomarinimicrobiota bacterium]
MVNRIRNITLLFFAVLSCAFGNVKTLDIGAAAPDFKLIGIDGQYYTLNSFAKADILVIIFTANHCPTAQAYEERIMKLVDDYKDKGVAVVCISSNNPDALRLDEYGYTDIGDSYEDMKQRARERNFNFPYLYDGDKQLAAKAYGAIATPHVFIFDKNRKLRYTGRIDNGENITKVTSHDTRNAIDALLDGKKVPVEKTKVFGCSIKWASKQKYAQATLEKMNAEKVELSSIDIAGIQELLENKSEKLRLINFWATWCGPCVAEFPELIKINRNYRKRKFEMITVSLDPPNKEEQALKFLKKSYASTHNYLFNSDDKYQLIEIVDKDWPGSLPFTIIVKPGGEIIYKKLGMIDPMEVRKVIIEYLGRYWEHL